MEFLLRMWFNDWVEVKKKGSDLFLYLSFRNEDLVLGPVIAPYPNSIMCRKYPQDRLFPVIDSQQLVSHTYPTPALSEVVAESVSRDVAKGLGSGSVRLIAAPFGVVQVNGCPHQVFESLESTIKSQFFSGHYTEQARWQVDWPLRRVDLNPVLEGVARGLRAKGSKMYEGRGCFEDLETALKGLDEHARIDFDKKTKVPSLFLPSLNGLYWRNDFLTSQDVMALPWCFIDTEKKFFAYEHAQNCHIALLYKHADGSVAGEVHTTENTGKGKVVAQINHSSVVFELFHYDTDVDMIRGASGSLRNYNPAVLCGHNIPYDIKELRSIKNIQSHKAFPVGLEGSEPITKVSLHFFQRIDCRGKIIIDTLRLARILDSYLPSFGLEVVAGIDKAITYQQFDALARNGDHKSALELSRYVAHDVLALYYHVFCGPWKDRLNVVVNAARVFGVSVSESSHSVSCVNKLQDKVFFRKCATYRQTPESKAVLIRMDKKFKKAWPSTLDGFYSQILSRVPPGRYEHVGRIYIPLERIMSSTFCISYPSLGLLHEESKTPMDKIAVCQFLKAFTHEPWLHWYYVRQRKDKAAALMQAAGLAPAEVKSLRDGFWVEYESLGAERKDELIGKELGTKRAAWLMRKALDEVHLCRRAETRFFARHACPPHSWYNRADGHAALIAQEFKRHECRVVGRKGQWLYVQGDLPKSLESELILLDRVTVLKVEHKGDYNIVFKERGSYHGVRVSLKKPSNLTLHEAHSIAGIIDGLLEDNLQSAHGAYWDGLDLLHRQEVGLESLLFKVPKEPLNFLGVDKQGERIFSYQDRDEGLKGYCPNWDVYERRFKHVVGRWLFPFGRPRQGKLF